ncbi:YncE family protein [Pedobacter sp. JCM 36344]|uniref:YncE family protein n=1 Tax=Pedobacter sp. JCM 36344 TaxID=3374280 RepID=UPI00397DE032
MNTKISGRILLFIFLSTASIGCRKDTQVAPEELINTLFPAEPNASVRGLYLVNEGNMSMNKASLDYVDFTTGSYRRNIYNQANPQVTKGLGDVGNDVGVYGSKLYVVVNGSNKVEVLNVKTGKRIQQIDIINCRYITFSKGKAYVSAYLGQIGDQKAPNGIVAEIDTTLLKETKRIEVGRQPEEMVVVGDNLYIANSGGYTPGNYENTISIINLTTFKETKRIPVAINLHRLKADRYGDLYVTSRGDYLNIPSKLYVISTQTDQIKKVFDVAAGNIVIDDDLAYLYSSAFNIVTGESIVSYDMINVKDEILISRKFITDGTDKLIKIPYGLAVHPTTKDVFVTDATDHITPGVLYCFDSTGKKKWSVETGDIPAQFAFVYK